MGITLANNAKSTLSAAATSTDTVLYVTDVSSFPALGTGDFFNATLESTSGAYEIVRVTQINAASFNVTRAQEGTIAIPFSSGARIELRLTVDNLEEFLLTGSNIDDTAFGASWDGDTDDAASRNALYDKFVADAAANAAAYQPLDADLTTLGAGGTAARAFLGLAIGTDVQAYDADTAKLDVAQTWTAAQLIPTITGDTITLSADGSFSVGGNTSTNSGHVYLYSGTSAGAEGSIHWMRGGVETWRLWCQGSSSDLFLRNPVLGTNVWTLSDSTNVMDFVTAPTIAGAAILTTTVAAATYQPLDADLTSWAAVTRASGFDTFVATPTSANLLALVTDETGTGSLVFATSPTLVTPTLGVATATNITAIDSTGATTAPAYFSNTTDSASVRVLRLDGNRATPAANDIAYTSYYLSDSAGNQDEFCRLDAWAAVVTSGSEQGRFRFSNMSAGVLTNIVQLQPNGFLPCTNDGLPLGLATVSWSDLFLASGGVINWNNGDVTLTHAADTLTGTGGQLIWTQATAAAGVKLLSNLDTANMQLLRLDHDRATPTAGDLGYISFYFSDSAGNQDEFGRIAYEASTVTSTNEIAELRFYGITSGSLVHRANINASTIRPGANDGLALGSATVSWADLFLASGAVIGFNNGNVVLTHSTGLLSVTTGDFQSNIPLSTETTGTLTVASANKHILATGGITLPNSVFAARNITTIDGNGTARTITRGSGVTMYVAGVDSATATLTANGVMSVYWRTASICILSGNVS